MEGQTYWHVADWDERTRRAVTHTGRLPVEQGKTQHILFRPILYSQGFHACPSLLDALFYAPTMPMIAIQEVVMGNEVVVSVGGRICAAQNRTCVRLLDWATTQSVLFRYALTMARSVIHLADVPDSVMAYVAGGDASMSDRAAEEIDDIKPPYSGAPFYAYHAVRHAVLFSRSKQPGKVMRYATEKAALAEAYNSQRSHYKYLSEQAERVFNQAVRRWETQLVGMVRAPSEPVF